MRTLSLVIGLFSILVTAARPAHACSRVGELVAGAVAGVGPGADTVIAVPRNAVFFGGSPVLRDAAGEAIPLAPVDGQGAAPRLWAAEDLLVAGDEYTIEGIAIRVEDRIDDDAPAQPVLTSGFLGDACGVQEAVALLAADPAEPVTYAVYLGESSAEVVDASEPIAHILVLSPGELNVILAGPSRPTFERSAFIAVEAIDRGGNVSARSEPLEILAASEGAGMACSAGGGAAPGASVIVLAAALLVVSAGRGRRRGARGGARR